MTNGLYQNTDYSKHFIQHTLQNHRNVLETSRTLDRAHARARTHLHTHTHTHTYTHTHKHTHII